MSESKQVFNLDPVEELKRQRKNYNRKKRKQKANSFDSKREFKGPWSKAVSNVYRVLAEEKKIKKKNKKRRERKQKQLLKLKGTSSISFGEAKVAEFLKSNKIMFQREKEFEDLINPKTNKKLRFDFYLPNINICIEYDGKQHFEYTPSIHGNSFDKGQVLVEQQQYRDSVKDEYCRDNNIKMIRISYKEFHKIDDILHEILLKKQIKIEPLEEGLFLKAPSEPTIEGRL